MRKTWLYLVVLVVSLSYSVADASMWSRPNNGRRPNLSTVVSWSTQTSIVIQHADGTRETVATEPNAALMPTFSTDGRVLAYATTRQDEYGDWYMAIAIVNRTTGQSSEILSDFMYWVTSPKLDPSGRLLAVRRLNNLEIWDVSDVSNPRFVKILAGDPDLGVGAFDWWDNGKGLVFTQEVQVEGNHAIYSQGLLDESPVAITDDDDYDYEFVTVSGNRIAFSRRYGLGGDWALYYRDIGSDEGDIPILKFEDWDLYVPADGIYPTWDPLSRGTRIIYHNYNEGYLRVYALDLATGIETTLSPVGATAFYPSTYVERVTPVNNRRIFGRVR